MIKVFLVEDEIVAREGIRESPLWSLGEFELAGEAWDGEMALPLIEETRPDILVTDIKMPFMDGLELSRIVRATYPWIKIIVISGYEEFSLARRAISSSVIDYLLKPICSEDLLVVLRKAADIIETEARERERVDDLGRRARSGAQFMAERLYADLLTGLVPSAEAIERAKSLSIDILARHYMVAVITPLPGETRDPARRYTEYLKADHIIEDALEGNPSVVRIGSDLSKTILVFRDDDPERLGSFGYSICHSIKYEVERKTSCTLAISIGGVRERVQGIAESYAQAQSAGRFDYIFGPEQIIGIADTQRIKLGDPVGSPSPAAPETMQSGTTPAGALPGTVLSFPARPGTEIIETLRRGQRQDAGSLVDGFLSGIDAGTASPLLRCHAIVDLYVSIAKFFGEIGGAAEATPKDLVALEDILARTDRAALRGFLVSAVDRAFCQRDLRREDRYGDLIDRAKRCIAERYADPDFSLNAVAEAVNVSPSHFSTIFSGETRVTFIEYLIRTRIDKAKERLKTTSMRSSEIAYEVGYKDPHYFSYIFKAKTGMSPTEFREGKPAPASGHA